MTLRRHLGSFVGSSPGRSPATGGDCALTPRAARIAVEPLHGIVCHLALGAAIIGAPVVNISVSGVALMRDAVAQWPILRTRIPAELHIQATAHPLSLELVHLTGRIAGCAFGQPDTAVVGAIARHFAPELEAADVVAAEASSGPGGRVAYWYRGRDNCGLYYIERGGAIERFVLTFLGNYLEGGAMRPVRFGIVASELDLTGDSAVGVRWLETLDAEELTASLRFIKRIPGLDPLARDTIVTLIC